ncbi:hypothetical protein BGP77_11820 [Saccharospirillum sp. MSK14-1]|uniref:MFS transporter n=1 Tax=Saccharospirillum sp. MSK14-1 TaxID=1897632 RepID=UPI000D3B4911|nr:MFS transporter [Saccharospirillum sp. MSK14-1]PTY38394.1 hypothetical protein BGP77_11820 [Saccharospirillum sp. MSK14-1]
MRSILLSITALFFGLALLLMGNSLLSTLLVIRGVSEGFSEQFLGLLSSSYYLGALLGTWFAGRMIRQMGHIRCFTFCAALLSCGTVLYVLLLSPVAWMIIRLLTGFGVFVLFTVIESWLNGQTPDEYRSRIFSLYMVVQMLAAAAAQQFLHLDSADAFTLFAIAAVLASAAVMPVSWTRLQQPNVALDMPKMDLPRLIESAPVAVTAVVISGLTLGPFWGLSPLFAASLGYSESQVAIFISLAVLGGAAIQYPVGRLSDLIDRRLVILGVLAATSLISLALVAVAYLLPSHLWLVVILAMLFVGLALAVYPIGVAHLVDHIHKDHLVAGSSGLLLLYGLGSFIGPALAGVGLQQLGGQSLPGFFALVTLLALLVVAWQLRQSRVVEKPTDYEGHFVAMVRTGPNVLPLHPDSEEEIEPPEERRHEPRPDAPDDATPID